jgi:hypothetical protein
VTKPHCQLKRRQPSHTFQRHADVNGLVAAMAAATSLMRPVLLMRRFPPNPLTSLGGLQNCHRLRPPRRHHIPPPFNPFPLGVLVLHTLREGMPIHSVTVDFLFHHGSTHEESTVLVMFADVMAHGILIHRITFSVGGNTGPALPTNLLVMAGIRWGGMGFFCFLFFWRHFLGDNFFGGRLPFFCLPFFWFLLVDCYMVHCPSFATFA